MSSHRVDKLEHLIKEQISYILLHKMQDEDLGFITVTDVKVSGPPDFQPGASWNYSNTNYTLLGMIAQRAAGCSLSAALRRRFLDPLGLTNTFLEAEEAVPGTIAHGWFDMNGDGRYDDISGIDKTSQTTAAWGAGGMVSTAADVARWACALYEGKVLSAASLSRMLAFREVSVPPTPIVGYGLGALRALFSGREYWGHGGNMIGYTAIMLYAPKERVSIALQLFVWGVR